MINVDAFKKLVKKGTEGNVSEKDKGKFLQNISVRLSKWPLSMSGSD